MEGTLAMSATCCRVLSCKNVKIVKDHNHDVEDDVHHPTHPDLLPLLGDLGLDHLNLVL